MSLTGASRVGSTRRRETGSVRTLSSVACAPTSNLLPEQCLELYESGMLPWDIEMTIEEPLSDDEDGVPHSVSSSESESENDSD